MPWGKTRKGKEINLEFNEPSQGDNSQVEVKDKRMEKCKDVVI
jgi:hypothetical protein